MAWYESINSKSRCVFFERGATSFIAFYSAPVFVFFLLFYVRFTCLLLLFASQLSKNGVVFLFLFSSIFLIYLVSVPQMYSVLDRLWMIVLRVVKCCLKWRKEKCFKLSGVECLRVQTSVEEYVKIGLINAAEKEVWYGA